MGALRLLIGDTMRRRRRVLLGLAVAAALSSGFVVTVADGARRTQTSWARLNAQTKGSFDAHAVVVAGADDAALDNVGAAIRSSAGILGAAAYQQYVPAYHGTEFDLFALSDVKERVDPIVESGRAPLRAGEALAGGDLFRAYHLHLGDTIEVEGEKGPVPITLVGRTVFPFLGNTGLGDTLIVDKATGDELKVGSQNAGFLLDLAPGASIRSVLKLLGPDLAVSPPSSPPAIVRIRDVRGIATALAVFLGAFAIAVLGFGVVAGGHSQRGDYAVARALGLCRRQVVAAYGWHAALTIISSAVVAAPLGLAAARVAWTATVRNLSILDAFAVGPAALAQVAIVAIVSAGVIALAAAAGAVRPSVAHLLRSE